MVVMIRHLDLIEIQDKDNMLQSARSNQFIFNFPKNFIPAGVSKRYDPYLNKIPGNLVTRSVDLVNYSIQSINFPSAEYTPVEQIDLGGLRRQFRSSVNKQELREKTLNVTMRLYDGFINYWMMFDTFDYYYNFSTEPAYLPEGMRLQILDSDGATIVTAEMRRVLFQTIGSLDLNFSENTSDIKTFDCTFVYNELFTKVEID